MDSTSAIAAVTSARAASISPWMPATAASASVARRSAAATRSLDASTSARASASASSSAVVSSRDLLGALLGDALGVRDGEFGGCRPGPRRLDARSCLDGSSLGLGCRRFERLNAGLGFPGTLLGPGSLALGRRHAFVVRGDGGPGLLGLLERPFGVGSGLFGLHTRGFGVIPCLLHLPRGPFGVLP